MKQLRFFIFITLLFILLTACADSREYPRLNIIFFIGDGMGTAQMDAASIYKSGETGKLSFEDFPVSAAVTTFSADSAVTDSAAAATAMATGAKVNNGVISQAIPGDGSDLKTLLEFFRSYGLSTGLVTTAYITHATPAAFGAHTDSRNNTTEIALDYFTQTKPNLLLGGGANGVSRLLAENNGYTVVTGRKELLSLNTAQVIYLSGQFGADHLPFQLDGLGTLPCLSEMLQAALKFLGRNPNGFFLMVEGGRIDHACHANDIQRMVFEMIEFDYTVQLARNWVSTRNDTLIVVTADHETGGLSVVQNNGAGIMPTVSWTTTGHTAVDVKVFAMGAHADKLATVEDNTDFYPILKDIYTN